MHLNFNLKSNIYVVDLFKCTPILVINTIDLQQLNTFWKSKLYSRYLEIIVLDW